MALANVCVAISNLCRDVAIAHNYGISATVDAYFLATNLPIFLCTVAIAACRSALTPILESTNHTRTPEYAKIVIRHAISRSFIYLLISLALLGASTNTILYLKNGNDSTQACHLISLFTWASLPMLLLSTLASFFDAPLFSHGRFFFTSIIRATMPLGIALGTIVLQSEYPLSGIFIGGFLGALLHLTTILLIANRATLASLKPPCATLPELSNFRQQFVYLAIGTSTSYINPVVNQYLAGLLGDNSVSVLSYANRIAVGIASVSAGALPPILLSHFSKMIARGQCDQIDASYRTFVRAGIWLGFFVSLLVWLFSEPVISFFYQSDHFSRSDVETVSRILSLLALQFPFLFLISPAYTMVSAASLNQYFIPLGILNALTNVSANLLLMNRFGVEGIALSTTITYTVSLLALNAVLLAKKKIKPHLPLAYHFVFAFTVCYAFLTASEYFPIKLEARFDFSRTVNALLVVSIFISLAISLNLRTVLQLWRFSFAPSTTDLAIDQQAHVKPAATGPINNGGT